MLASTPFLVLAFLWAIPHVLGWGAAGHEIVATIAQIHLHPDVFPALCDMLNFSSTQPNTPLCHLAPIANWADKVRFQKRWSASLHYVGGRGDHPPESCLFPGEGGWAGRKGANVLGAVRNVTGILEDSAAGIKAGGYVWVARGGEEVESEALKFLVHFLGDMHMPLHLTGRDRGGNSIKVRFGKRLTNLHSLWDNFLIAKGLRTVPGNYSHPLSIPRIESALRGTIYDSYVRRVMFEGVLGMWKDEIPSWLSCPAPLSGSEPQQEVMGMAGGVASETDDEVVCPYHWTQPIHALNCEFVWPKELDESYTEELLREDSYLQLDTPEYAGMISDRWVVEKLLAMAGIRLAGMLNYLLVGGGGLRVVLVDV